MSRWEAADLSAWIRNGLPEGAEEFLSRPRRTEMKRYAKAAGRCLSAGAEMLLRGMLSDVGIRTVRDWTWKMDPYGKPRIAELPEMCFNLSHSGRYAACAVGGKPLGADIQMMEPKRDAVIRRCFLPEEQERIAIAEDPDVCFTEIWAVKEAYLKWTGEGIRRRMDTFLADFSREQILDRKTGEKLPFRAAVVRGEAVFAVCGEDLPAGEPQILSAEELWEQVRNCRMGTMVERR